MKTINCVFNNPELNSFIKNKHFHKFVVDQLGHRCLQWINCLLHLVFQRHIFCGIREKEVFELNDAQKL